MDVSRGITIVDPVERESFYRKRNEKVTRCYMPAIRLLSEHLREMDEATAGPAAETSANAAPES